MSPHATSSSGQSESVPSFSNFQVKFDIKDSHFNSSVLLYLMAPTALHYTVCTPASLSHPWESDAGPVFKITGFEVDA